MSVEFDLNDPVEVRAWTMAQSLARPHGRRKKVLILLLNALKDYEEQTGREVSAERIGGDLIAKAMAGRLGGGGRTETPAIAPTEIVMSSADKSSEVAQAATFAGTLASRFRRTP